MKVEGFFVSSPNQHEKRRDHPQRPPLTVRLAPAESSDGFERLRRAYELVLSLEAEGEQLLTGTGEASLLTEPRGTQERSGAAEPADGE